MTRARHVLNAIDDALVIRQRHPALFGRMCAAGADCVELGRAYDFYTAGVSTRWWFVAERRLTGGHLGTWRSERGKRRAAGKRQRRARKANR